MNRKKYLKIRKIMKQFEKDRNIKKAVDNKGLALIEKMLIGRLCRRKWCSFFSYDLIETKAIKLMTKKYSVPEFKEGLKTIEKEYQKIRKEYQKIRLEENKQRWEGAYIKIIRGKKTLMLPNYQKGFENVRKMQKSKSK